VRDSTPLPNSKLLQSRMLHLKMLQLGLALSQLQWWQRLNCLCTNIYVHSIRLTRFVL